MLTGGALRAYSTHAEAPAELLYFNAPTKWEKLRNILIDTFGIELKEKRRRLVQGGSWSALKSSTIVWQGQSYSKLLFSTWRNYAGKTKNSGKKP